MKKIFHFAQTHKHRLICTLYNVHRIHWLLHFIGPKNRFMYKTRHTITAIKILHECECGKMAWYKRIGFCKRHRMIRPRSHNSQLWWPKQRWWHKRCAEWRLRIERKYIHSMSDCMNVVCSRFGNVQREKWAFIVSCAKGKHQRTQVQVHRRLVSNIFPVLKKSWMHRGLSVVCAFKLKTVYSFFLSNVARELLAMFFFFQILLLG